MCERGGLIRRHFFLIAALCVLGLMVVAGGIKLATTGGGDNPAKAAGGAAAGGGRNGGVIVSRAVAIERPFVDRLEVLGAAKGRQSVTVTSNTTELITGVHFTDGAHVRKGQVLVDLKAQAQSADIAQAQAALDLAQINYRRWKSLGDQGIAAKATVDQYQTSVQQAQAGLDMAKSRLGDRVIRAPFSGVVGLTDVTPGTLINPGGAIVSLDDISVIRVDFDVPDRYLSTVRVGLPINARTDAYPNETIQGRIAMLDSRVDQRSHSIKARAEFPNAAGRLKPGMLVRVGVAQGERRSVAVPQAAVQFDGDQAMVFVLAPRGRGLVAQQRLVLTGMDDAGFVEIKQGLKPGEAVVADGVNRISPNQAVRVAGDGARGQGGGGRGGARAR